jgi:hypothetical protein
MNIELRARLFVALVRFIVAGLLLISAITTLNLVLHVAMQSYWRVAVDVILLAWLWPLSINATRIVFFRVKPKGTP